MLWVPLNGLGIGDQRDEISRVLARRGWRLSHVARVPAVRVSALSGWGQCSNQRLPAHLTRCRSVSLKKLQVNNPGGEGRTEGGRMRDEKLRIEDRGLKIEDRA